MSDIIDASDSAFRGYLVTVNGLGGGQEAGGIAIFTGKDPETKLLPCIICAADGDNVEEDPKGSGNYWLDVSIFVKTAAPPDLDPQGNTIDSKTNSVSLANVVFTALQVDNLDTLVNNNGFTIFPTGYIFGAQKRGQDKQGAWIDELPIRIYCAAFKIPA